MKEIWRKRWLESINELTSINLQRKSWLDRTNMNPHWSFVEFMCSYFDDTLVYDYKYLVEINWVTKEEYEIIKEWHNALDKYDAPKNNDFDHKAILNDIKWIDIVQAGANAKSKLAEKLNSVEKEYLITEIDYLAINNWKADKQ